METMISKVYVLPDENGRITRCEGGYSMANIRDLSQWVQIDEGAGDRFNLCQSHYFDGGLYTEDGSPRWKLENGTAVLRSAAEMEADRKPEPEPTPSTEERIAELEEAMDLLLSGVTE